MSAIDVIARAVVPAGHPGCSHGYSHYSLSSEPADDILSAAVPESPGYSAVISMHQQMQNCNPFCYKNINITTEHLLLQINPLFAIVY